MNEGHNWRDYSLTGPESAPGFGHSQWYSSPIPRKRLKQLMQRSDRKGLINSGLWMSLVVGSGLMLVLTWGTGWAIVSAVIYGLFYGSGADSRWHEFGHGTVMRTRWLNTLFYHLASFMSLKNPYLWRWSHTRHHTDTIIVGRDPEIAFPRPPSLWGMAMNLLYIRAGISEVTKMILLSMGRLTEDQKDFLIESERPKVFLAARIHLAIHTGVILLSLMTGSWLPVMLVGLPTFYGSWLHHLLAATQHAGLAEDIPDHRLNSRTVLMNPLFCFIYSNMNYHVEHHMYPMVPFYSLPDLHREIRDDCPDPYPSVIAAYAEMLPAMFRQQKDPFHYVRRRLPDTAGPTPPYKRPTAMA